MPHSTPIRKRWLALGIVLVAVLALGLAIGLMLRAPKLTEQQAQAVVVATVVREAPQSFLVTGTVDIAGTSTINNATVLLPGILDWTVSEDVVEVKAPGRVSYGFDVRLLRSEDIVLDEDGAVVVRLPELALQGVDVNMDRLEFRTERGWLSSRGVRSDALTRQAFENLQTVIRQQGNAYLRESERPSEFSARAVEAMLRPALEAAGMEEPRIRVVIGESFVWSEPTG